MIILAAMCAWQFFGINNIKDLCQTRSSYGMGLNANQQKKILNLLRSKMEEKIEKYSRETSSMPFLTRLIQNDERVASYSLIHSWATTLGQSMYEELAVIISQGNCDESDNHVKMGGGISDSRKTVINGIMRDLRNGTREPDKIKESKEILATSNKGEKFQKEGNIADFYMSRNKQEYYFEIKTVKPNIDVFTASKKKMLDWVARKDKDIKSIVALPYNPYAPKPYARFTEQNLYDKKEEFLVGKEFWDFLGGKGVYEELLDLFDKVGKEYKTKLNKMLTEVGKIASRV